MARLSKNNLYSYILNNIIYKKISILIFRRNEVMMYKYTMYINTLLHYLYNTLALLHYFRITKNG